MNSYDSLHHIVGRGSKGSKIERSPLNAAPMCNEKCHIQKHAQHTTDHGKFILLKKTYKFIDSLDLELTELDWEFLKEYSQYYEKETL